jgi:hypothetical protein
VIFDRSWYNRAGVERVMGYAGDGHVHDFLNMAPGIGKAMVESGVILLKYWLEVGMEEKTRRLAARINGGRKLRHAATHRLTSAGCVRPARLTMTRNAPRASLFIRGMRQRPSAPGASGRRCLGRGSATTREAEHHASVCTCTVPLRTATFSAAWSRSA